MARTVLNAEQMQCVYAGKFNRMLIVPTDAGPREVLAHNGKRLAAKMMVISLNEGVVLKQGHNPTNTLPSFVETLRFTGPENFFTLLLAADRPVTYDANFDLTANYQLEFPGGIAEGKEKSEATARREGSEESGVDENHVIQTAPLVPFWVAHDAGSNLELYQMHVCLVRRAPRPPAREGVIPEKCWLGPLLQVKSYLQEQGSQGIAIEGFAWMMACQLLLELRDG